jgi:hypothetical protein
MVMGAKTVMVSLTRQQVRIMIAHAIRELAHNSLMWDLNPTSTAAYRDECERIIQHILAGD